MAILKETLMISLKMLEILLKLHKCKFIYRFTSGMLCFLYSKVVDNEDWKEIDEKRRKRRLTRKERNEKRESGRFGSDGEENKKDLNGGTTCEPFLPRRISDLRVGYLVRVISAAGSKVSPGIVRSA